MPPETSRGKKEALQCGTQMRKLNGDIAEERREQSPSQEGESARITPSRAESAPSIRSTHYFGVRKRVHTRVSHHDYRPGTADKPAKKVGSTAPARVVSTRSSGSKGKPRIVGRLAGQLERSLEQAPIGLQFRLHKLPGIIHMHTITRSSASI